MSTQPDLPTEDDAEEGPPPNDAVFDAYAAELDEAAAAFGVGE